MQCINHTVVMMVEWAEEELGVVMVFSLVSAIQEKLGEMLDNEVKAKTYQKEQEAKQKEEVSRC